MRIFLTCHVCSLTGESFKQNANLTEEKFVTPSPRDSGALFCGVRWQCLWFSTKTRGGGLTRASRAKLLVHCVVSGPSITMIAYLLCNFVGPELHERGRN